MNVFFLWTGVNVSNFRTSRPRPWLPHTQQFIGSRRESTCRPLPLYTPPYFNLCLIKVRVEEERKVKTWVYLRRLLLSMIEEVNQLKKKIRNKKKENSFVGYDCCGIRPLYYSLSLRVSNWPPLRFTMLVNLLLHRQRMISLV